MAINIKYRVPGKVKARYVRKSLVKKDVYEWCEQSLEKPEYDVAQGTCNSSDLPKEIMEECDKYIGSFYACEWPI